MAENSNPLNGGKLEVTKRRKIQKG